MKSDSFWRFDPPAPRALPAIAVTLFDAAAERAALQSGRPVSQERTELLTPGGIFTYTRQADTLTLPLDFSTDERT